VDVSVAFLLNHRLALCPPVHFSTNPMLTESQALAQALIRTILHLVHFTLCTFFSDLTVNFIALLSASVTRSCKSHLGLAVLCTFRRICGSDQTIEHRLEWTFAYMHQLQQLPSCFSRSPGPERYADQSQACRVRKAITRWAGYLPGC